jgi:hypothetical protein
MSFRWNSAKSGRGQSPRSTTRRPAPSGPGEEVRLAFASCGRRLFAGDQPRLLQPTEGDVDLAGVDALAEWAERRFEACSQLVSLRRVKADA